MPGAPLSEVLRRFERHDIYGSKGEWDAAMRNESRLERQPAGAQGRAVAGEKRQHRQQQQQQQQQQQGLPGRSRLFEPVPVEHSATVADMLEYVSRV